MMGSSVYNSYIPLQEMIDKRLLKSIEPDADLVFFIYQVFKRRRPDDWVIYFLQVLRDDQEFELLHKLGTLQVSDPFQVEV